LFIALFSCIAKPIFMSLNLLGQRVRELLRRGSEIAVLAEVDASEEPSLVMHPQEGEATALCLLGVKKPGNQRS
jgi:hypothetical protein